MKLKTFPVFLVFLVMGFGDAVGPFVGLAKNNFYLTNFEAQLIAFMGFIADTIFVAAGFIVSLLALGYITIVSFRPVVDTRKNI